MRFIRITLIVMILAAAAPASAQGPLFLVKPNPVDRGGLAVLEVEALDPSAQLQAVFAGKPLLLVPAGPKFYGLAAADVALKPGYYPLNVRWQQAKGSWKSLSIQVQVRDRDYGARIITLKESLLKLTPAEMELAKKQRQQVLEVLSVYSLKRLWRGAFELPVPGPVISIFGKRSIINGRPGNSTHNGVDLQAAEGDPIKAPAAGKVLLAADHFFTGNAVYLDHGLGLITMYFHLSAIKVQENQMVEKGQVIGLVGSTGLSEGAHLHYGLYLNHARIDPMVFHETARRLNLE